MTNLADIELLRTRWRRALERHALNPLDRDDSPSGVSRPRLQEPSVQLIILPTDPEVECLHLDDALWAWLEAHKSVNIDGWAVQFGDQKCPTAHAAALANWNGIRAWDSYLAVHRSGAIEFGFGDRGGQERWKYGDKLVRVFYRISIVAYTWAILQFSAAHFERLSLNGP